MKSHFLFYVLCSALKINYLTRGRFQSICSCKQMNYCNCTTEQKLSNFICVKVFSINYKIKIKAAFKNPFEKYVLKKHIHVLELGPLIASLKE